MPAKTTTQKLAVRWQDRVWQPRIRRPAARVSRTGTALPAVQPPAALPAGVVRPCRRGLTATLVRHVILAFRPRRRNQA